MAESTAPRIRFAGFTDAWEQRRLGDEFIFLRNNTLPRAELSDTVGDIRNVHYGDILTRLGAIIDLSTTRLPRVAREDTEKQLRCDQLQDGDVVVADTAEDATAGKCSELRGIDSVEVVSGLHTMPLRPTRRYAVGFLAYYLNGTAFHSQLLPLMQGIKVISISRQALANTTMMVPTLPEQRRIGELFSALDSLITLHQRKLDALRNVKKSLLDRMFPREGQTEPELRFAGFTDAWEQRRLGDVARFSKGVGYSKSDITDEGEPLFLYGRLYTSYSTTVTNVDTYANPLPGSVRSVGNEVVTPASGETAEDIAVASAILSPGILLGGGLNIVIPEQFLDTVFLALSITSGGQHDELAQSAQGKTVVHLYNADLAASHVRYPPLPEQRRIGELFSALDNLITLHQRKLDALRNVKKSLLDRMFV